MRDPEKSFERFIRLFFGVLGGVVMIAGVVMFCEAPRSFPVMSGSLFAFQMVFGASAIAISIFWPRVIAWLDRS